MTAFWETGWFGGSIAVVAVGLVAWWGWQQQRREREEFAQALADERARAARTLEEKEAALAGSQAKSELISTLSHEIRAHLNGIVGSTDLLLDTPLDVRQRDHLHTLRTSSEALHNVLNDIVDYSRIDTGQFKLESALFDLRQPLVEVVEIVSPRAVLKNLEPVLMIAPEIPLVVSGDVARLRQILLNLATNAVRFTTQGFVALRVECTTGPDEVARGTVWLRFSVSDTGVGIPPEAQATIFDRFTPADGATARKFGGSGLELAICKRLVECMGGKIGVRSEPNQGSEFWFVLPLAADLDQPRSRPPFPDTSHVIVLDDLAAARVATGAMLARLGISHEVAATVAEAAACLRSAREAGKTELVLLLDDSVALGKRDELAALLADQPALQSPRVVLLTLQPEGALRDVSIPVAAVLRKPLLRSELLVEAVGSGKQQVAPTPGRLTSRAPFPVAGAPPESAGAKRHILVVEDDEISRRVSSMMLERLGCAVDLAVNGFEAIESVRRSAYTLVFMDCRMPELDGFEATRRIRAELGDRAPPVVALTANTTAKDRERAFAAGMCDFVTKPVHKAELARVIQRWGRKSGRSAT